MTEITINGLNEFGDGVAFTGKQVVRVARTVPGDRVRVRVSDNGKRYVYGDLETVLAPSEHRVDPACPAFVDGCGGCQWLHFDYSRQLAWKTRILSDMLKQRCHVPITVKATIGMPAPQAFRNKLSLRNIGGKLYFMQDFSDKALSPGSCRVETPEIQIVWQYLRTMRIPPDILQIHIRSADEGKVGLHFFAQTNNSALKKLAETLVRDCPGIAGIGATASRTFRLLAGSAHIDHRCKDIVYRIPLNGFFQTNYRQAEVLLDTALKQLALRPSDSVLDLYCGSGFFTLPIARKSSFATGIENNTASIAASEVNASLNAIGNTRFIDADAGLALRDFAPGDFDIVLLDPPRQGCEQAVLDHIARIAPRRIVYVSCSPESLSRDLKSIVQNGYRVGDCQPVDMFPHTSHIETVVTLRRD